MKLPIVKAETSIEMADLKFLSSFSIMTNPICGSKFTAEFKVGWETVKFIIHAFDKGENMDSI